MAGLIALFICALVALELFRLDPEPKGRISKAFWLPFLWTFIFCSRNVSAWLGVEGGNQAESYIDGSPLDRAVLTVLLALGLLVLIKRQRQVVALLRSNGPILLYFAYCAISILWSGYPDVAFKRWFRAIGDLVMILILLSETDWLLATKRLLTRLSYILVPLSIVFIRYYPQLGRTYSMGGVPGWSGVTTDKNALGMTCLLFGLAAVMRCLQIYLGEEGERKRRPMMAQGALVVMSLYLIWESHCATALACFFLAGGVMLATYLFRLARTPLVLHLLVAAVIAVPASALFLGIGSDMVQDLGRDSTFTGRTWIWQIALSKVQNPIFGTGFESFWIGPRLKELAILNGEFLNQAHNGYIELYLNLGWVGIALLGFLLVTGYRRIAPAVCWWTQGGSLRLAFFISAVAYNFSEAGFKMTNPVWIFFLLSIAVLPKAPARKTLAIGSQIHGGHSTAELPVRRHKPAAAGAALPEFIRRCAGIFARVRFA